MDTNEDAKPTMEEQCELFDHPLMGHACPCGRSYVGISAEDLGQQ